jgi:hypothetical protein
VRVHNDEGPASHIDPKPCMATREGRREASVGGCIGQPLSRDSHLSGVPTAFRCRKATRFDSVTASDQTTPRGQRPWHVQKLLTRKPGDLATDHKTALVRIGKAMS